MKNKIINCVECDGFSEPTFRKCAGMDCPSDPKLMPLSEELDLVVFKNKTFTKLWYVKKDEFVVTPFFVDVVIVPAHGKVIKKYKVKDALVKIIKSPGDIQPTYAIEIPDLQKSFKDLWTIYSKYEAKDLSDRLLEIWIKQMGILDYLLSDPALQEININPPEFSTSMRLVHQEFDECLTNIYPTLDFLNYLSTYMKMKTGRPLNKAQPQLDGELKVERRKARVAAVRNPFSIYGTGYSIRVHRELPWTLPLFMDNNTLNGWFAGLMDLAIAHGRTFLVAGPRGSGKTALLGSLILEILPKYRIITIEDTQELPIDAYKEIGYDLLALKVRSALMEHGLEVPFDKGLRTSLRLGDSVLIIGEIRSKEAIVLYEAMRVGAMSNVVAGTVHADNPYGVFDRVVNDLGVPKGSFKVTDLIIMVKQIKTPTALTRDRRVISVTEVLKDWEEKPKFQTLLEYDPKKDELVPTDALLKGKSIFLQNILKTTKGYENYDALLRDLKLRSWAKERFVSVLGGDKDLLEAKTNTEANVEFVLLFEKHQPLDSPANEQKFKKDFEKMLKEKSVGLHHKDVVPRNKIFEMQEKPGALKQEGVPVEESNVLLNEKSAPVKENSVPLKGSGK